LQALKKEYALDFKPIEELLKSDPHPLTDEELFRLIQLDYPQFKSLEDLTDEVLGKIIKGEYIEPAAD
jgi:hypothetical protein